VFSIQSYETQIVIVEGDRAIRVFAITVRRINKQEVAELRRVTVARLAQERYRGEGPPYLKDGGRVLYPADQDTDGVTELYVRVIEAHWNTGSGNWATDANWNNGAQSLTITSGTLSTFRYTELSPT